eukprot:4221645-Amphidinium_carterae.1
MHECRAGSLSMNIKSFAFAILSAHSTRDSKTGNSSASVTSCLRPSARQASTSSCRTTSPNTSRVPSLWSKSKAPKETCKPPGNSSHAPSVKTTTGGRQESGDTSRG